MPKVSSLVVICASKSARESAKKPETERERERERE